MSKIPAFPFDPDVSFKESCFLRRYFVRPLSREALSQIRLVSLAPSKVSLFVDDTSRADLVYLVTATVTFGFEGERVLSNRYSWLYSTHSQDSTRVLIMIYNDTCHTCIDLRLIFWGVPLSYAREITSLIHAFTTLEGSQHPFPVVVNRTVKVESTTVLSPPSSTYKHFQILHKISTQ